jgi:hypothetical protein
MLSYSHHKKYFITSQYFIYLYKVKIQQLFQNYLMIFLSSHRYLLEFMYLSYQIHIFL